MTWRERIQAARERGKFTPADWKAYWNPKTCLLGETVTGVRGHYNPAFWNAIDNSITREGTVSLQERIQTVMRARDFDATESLLDAIEDRALQLKREGLTDTPPTPSPAAQAEG